MNRIERFLAKPVKKIIGGEELEFKPLTVKDLPILLRLENEAEKPKAMQDLIKRYLFQIFPEATDEQRDNFEFKYFKEFMEAISEVNGLENKK